LITEARPEPLGEDGNPTTNFKFYDPEFAKFILCSHKVEQSLPTSPKAAAKPALLYK
jgi:hypothetical protein